MALNAIKKETHNMKIKFKEKIIAGLVMGSLLSACATQGTREAIDLYTKSERETAEKIGVEKNNKYDPERAGTVTRVTHAYNGSKTIPLKSNPILPEQFNMLKVFHFPGKVFSITEAAAQITEVSGIQVRIAQDILKDSTKLSPIYLDANATTAGMLDQVTAVDGFSWEYKDGVVYISKFITQEYRIKSVFGSRAHTYRSGSTGNTQAATAQGGGSSGGQIQSGFTSQTDIVNKSDVNPMVSIENAVKSVLTKPGGTVIATATNSLIVTDTAEGQRRAAEVIDRENEILTRNVTYRVQVFSLTDDTANEGNLDIQTMIQNASKYGIAATSPVSTVSANGGGISYTVLTGGTPGKFDGSKAVLQLLATRGKTTTVYDVNVPTRNFVSTPLNLTTQIPYLAETSPAPASGTGTAGGTPGLKLGNAVTGFKMDFTSNIFDSNTISLQLAIGLVDLIEIRKVSAGANLGSLEAPVTTGFELAPDLFLKPYETTLITGYERSTNKYSRSGLGQEWPLALGGGSVTSSGKKEKLFILITPTIVSNAY
jgi:type IVB pilus formation R64 PilN family outer membrane protein